MSSTLQSPGDGPVSRAVFLSYAREDTPAAQRLADALRSQGVEVWLDQSELRGGDAWDQKIRRQIKECALFLPVISERTQSRGEGYFRLEWKLAVERTHLMAEGVPFLAPIAIDATPEGAAIVPSEFMRVQWIRLPGALPTPQFVAQVQRMLESPGKAPGPVPRASTAALPPPSRNVAWIVGGIVALALVGAVLFAVSRRSPVPAPPTPAPAPASAAAAAADATTPGDARDAKSVAVLPFENMSEDKDNAFFTDGVHEDVLTNLSFIHDLHVVSRTSVMQYRNTTKPIKQIGRELGVAYVLEGSVRREGNKVRVTGQLIDARTDEHVWAKAYDRDLNDIFAIQAELAQSIADALQSVLSPQAKVLLARRPTENSAAFDDYLKARQLRSSNFFQGLQPAIALLDEAVRLDPGFAVAWGELGSCRAFLYFGNKSPGQLQLAKTAVDTALRLAPDDPSVIESVGDYYYYGYRDYARATEQYMRLAQVRPGDPGVYYSLGLIQRREGRFADAMPNLRLAVKLDPTNRSYMASLVETLAACRHFDESLALSRKLVASQPKDLVAAAQLAVDTFVANGSTDELKAYEARTVDAAQRPLFLYTCKLGNAARGDWAGFSRFDLEQRYFDGNVQDPHWNQDTVAAEVFAESGDMTAARARAAENMAVMKSLLVQEPDNADLWSDMALAYAILGQKDEAVAAAKKSEELLPDTRDAVAGPSNALGCAIALCWAGEKDAALAELKRLFQVPYGANIYAARVAWLPLQDDPRFKELVLDPRNNDPLF